MANSFSLMTTIIGQIIPSNCTEVLHVKNVSQVMKIVTILIGVSLVMISYFDPPWTFYSLVPSFWTFFDRMMIIWWCQIEIKKRLFKKIYESVWCFFLGDEKIRESREREKEKNDSQYRNCVGHFIFWDFNFRRLFSVLQCIGLGFDLKASGIPQRVSEISCTRWATIPMEMRLDMETKISWMTWCKTGKRTNFSIFLKTHPRIFF